MWAIKCSELLSPTVLIVLWLQQILSPSIFQYFCCGCGLWSCNSTVNMLYIFPVSDSIKQIKSTDVNTKIQGRLDKHLSYFIVFLFCFFLIFHGSAACMLLNADWVLICLHMGSSGCGETCSYFLFINLPFSYQSIFYFG